MESNREKEPQWMGKIFAAVLSPMLILAALAGTGIVDMTSGICISAAIALVASILLNGSMTKAFRNAVQPLLHSVRQLEESVSSMKTTAGAISEEFSNAILHVQDLNDHMDASFDRMENMAKEIMEESGRWAGDAKASDQRAAALGKSMDVCREKAKALAQGVQKVKEVFHLAEDAVNDMKNDTKETDLFVLEIQNRVKTAGCLAAELQEASECTVDLAGQADLLALNASIEAARSGEMGKGFSIVAGEIRLLAGQCAEFADKIAEIVRKTDDYLEEDAKNVQTAALFAKRQEEKLEHTTRMIENVSQEMNLAGCKSDEMAEWSEELLGKKKEAFVLLENLARFIGENAGKADEVWEETKSLHKLKEDYANYADTLTHISSELCELVK